MSVLEGSDLDQLVAGTKSPSPEHRQLCELYRSSFSQYDHFRNSIQILIGNLLRDEKIYATTESRAKDPDSLERKLQRKKYRSLEEIPDLAGVRIIVRYLSDVSRAVELLDSEFDVRESVPHLYGEPNAFGYLSHHLVVNISDDRRRLREWKPYGDFVCEVQVRTILQHAWASISHSLDYKSEEDVPAAVRRDLFKVAALLESADDIFERYRLAVHNLRNSYAKSDDWRQLPIDVESLATHWDKLPISRFVSAASLQRKIDPEDAVLPFIVRCCELLKIDNLGRLTEYLEQLDYNTGLNRINTLNDETRKDFRIVLFRILMTDERVKHTKDRDYIVLGRQ
jgi:ppGpp synthetase/RelA/SpoT-type nucleotidyltranferase